MRNSYDVIEIDNYVILSTLQNLHFRERSLLSIDLDYKHAKPYIGKIFKTSIVLITKYLNLNWTIVKPLIFI